MLLVGQHSTFPTILFIENRMRIERLIEEGLLSGSSAKTDMEGIAARGQESMHVRGHMIRSSAEPSTEDEDERFHMKKEDRRASVIRELKRQGRVFHDDSEVDRKDVSESENGKAE